MEGGRNPLKRFGESLKGVSDSAQKAFYADNFINMMGAGLAPELRYPPQTPKPECIDIRLDLGGMELT